jgi:hypothetical protein
MTEFALPEVLPELMGSNARFVPLSSTTLLNEKIVDLNAISGNTLVGYIVNGITSPAANISSSDPSLSWATSLVLEVYIDKTITSAPLRVQEPWRFSVSPNPSKNGRVQLQFEGEGRQVLSIEVFDKTGRKVMEDQSIRLNQQGRKNLTLDLGTPAAGLYYIRATGPQFTHTERLIIEP